MTSKVASNVIPVAKKYTQQSAGLYETIRAFFAVDSTRSNGIPVKHYRNPTPGGLNPQDYDDPVTIPAADIADNPYWKRDVRRAYPKISAVTQGDVVGLLSVGSAASPSPKLLAGEEGSKQLVLAKEEGEKGLATYFEKEKGASVLGEGGLPPTPVSFKAPKVVPYQIPTQSEQAYPDVYPCRVFV